MTKEWKQSELNRIYKDNPELQKVPIVGLDEIVVEFLKLHDVNVSPPKKKSGRNEGAKAAVIGIVAGLDFAGDSIIIEGQKDQTIKQEWTSWKQWALDHKEFEPFRKENIEKPKAHNENIFASLEDPKVQIELEPIFKEFQEFKKIQNQNKRFLIIGICILLVSGYLGFYVPKVIEIYNEDKIEYENRF